jgi:hypothetical protein
MADAIDETNSAAGTADDVDTSPNDELEAEEALEDDGSSWDDGEEISDDDESESDSEEETEEAAATDSDEETNDDSADDVESDDSSEESKAEDTTAQDVKEGAERRIAERAKREAQRQQDKAKAQQDFLSGAQDDTQLALRQLQINAYNNTVTNNIRDLESATREAVAAIDLFKTGTPAVQNRLLRAVDNFEAQHVVKDRNGDPIEVTGNLVQYLQAEADSIKEILGDGAKLQTTAKSNQKARVVQTPSRAPKKAKEDPMLAGFDEEANRW